MNQIQEPRYFTLTPAFAGGATVELGSSGSTAAGEMAYTVEISSDVPGKVEITQTCRLGYIPDPGGYNFSDWRCDGAENYEGPLAVSSNLPNVITFNDSPQNGTYVSQTPITLQGNFIDYIRFQPSNAGSIYATLG